MALAVNHLIEIQGGAAVVSHGKLLGALPLPVAWSLRFGPPVHFYADLDPHSAEDPTLVSRLAAQVRQTLEDLLRTQRSARRSVIFG